MFNIGDKVITKHDVYDQFEHPLDRTGALSNLGKESFIISKIEWWQPVKANIIHGKKSDKRNYEVWHNENDLEIHKS